MACGGNGSGDVGEGGEQVAKVQRMAELLNRTGRKLLELKGWLHQEASQTNEGFDFSVYLPAVDRYQNEVRAADSIRMLHSLNTGKQKYHFYLEELQNVSLMNTSSLLSDLNKSLELQDQEPANSPSPGRLCIKTLRRSFTQEMNNNVSFVKGIDETDADSQSKPLKTSIECSDVIEKMQGTRLQCQEDNHEGHREARRMNNEENSFGPRSPRIPQSDVAKNIHCSDYEKCFRTYDTSSNGRDKYKVVKKKTHHRSRLPDDEIYLPIHRSKLKSPTSFSTPTNHGNISLSRRSGPNIMDQDLSEGTTEVTSPVDTKPKRASETWYEVKARSSTSSLHDRLSHGEPHGSFSMRGSPSVDSPSKSKKSVRFSLSPSERRTPSRLNKLTPREVKYSSDSSDDDVGFENVEFPIVKRNDVSRTNSGRRRYYY